jgi:hypothetical protein
MNVDRGQVAMQVVLDALALRGPGQAGGPFRMVAIDPSHWPAERLRLARQYGSMVPGNATAEAAASIATKIAPHLLHELGEGTFDSCGR